MIWGGLPAEIVEAAEDGRISIMLSEEIVGEIARILSYPRLREIYEGAGVSREELVETVLRISQLVEVKSRVNLIQEDPSDNKFLECALDGHADYVVSGDDHLLKIEHYQRIRILSVRQFLKLLEEPESTSSLKF
jgi:hypothetical protein